MKKNFMRLFLIGVLATFFSFTPKNTSYENLLLSKASTFSLTLNEYNITLTNPTGWYLAVWVTPASSTGAVELQFVGDIHEPNGTILSGVNFTFYNLTGGTYTGPATGYEYQLVVPVSESGYPAGSSVANVHNVVASVYYPFP